jgi:hypothetical protein
MLRSVSVGVYGFAKTYHVTKVVSIDICAFFVRRLLLYHGSGVQARRMRFK